MFAATVGWSHRAALKASLFPEEGDGDKEKAADSGGVKAVSARPASAVAAADGDAVLLSASSSPAASVSPSGQGAAQRLASFRQRGERGRFGSVVGALLLLLL